MTLYENLIAAGLPVQSATEQGEITSLPGVSMTLAQLLTMNEIALQYLYPVAYETYIRIRDRFNASRVTAKAIPNWATWTQADWSTYFDANLSDAQVDLVTTLATARVMLKRQNLVIQNLVKLLIAIRDDIWPDLPEP